MDIQQPDSIASLAKGLAVRGGILSVASVVVGAWIFILATKTASGAAKIGAGLFLLTAGAGLVTWEVKARRNLAHRRRIASRAPGSARTM